jgi:protein gp37
MSDKTSIEWAESSWNPLRGQNARHTCARISPGCDNCYAATMTRRGLGGTAPIDYGVGETPNDPSRLDEAALLQPHHWKKPRRVFVCSMTDIAGGWVERDWFHAIWTVMAETPRHTYQVLTKRPSRLKMLIEWFQQDAPGFGPYPLPNVWVGTTIESDAYVWRANKLRETPAAVRWISAEPLLSGLPSLDLTGIDWLVAGGESGPGSRPMSPGWVRDLRNRCQDSGTAYFFKQWGAWAPYQYVESGVQGQRPLPTSNGGNYVLTKDGHWLVRLNKKATGRLLDGRTWDEFPAPAARASEARR